MTTRVGLEKNHGHREIGRYHPSAATIFYDITVTHAEL